MNNNLDFIDLLSIISFCVGLQNLDLNISQENLDNQTKELDRELRSVVDEIHRHLQEQDNKLDMILKYLEAYNDNSRSV